MRSVLFMIALLVSLSSYSQQIQNVKKGDIIDINGVKGIVFHVDETGEHGTLMSVKAFRSNKHLYCLKSSLLKGIDLTSDKDGKANTNHLFNAANARKNSLANYPVFQWCNSLGKGWYIPAVEQLRTFVNYWLGNDAEVDWDEESPDDGDQTPHHKKINRKLLDAGGLPFLNGVVTSTIKKGKMEMFEYDRQKDTWQFNQVNPMSCDEYSVGRAFYDF